MNNDKNELMALLERPFPPDQIKQRKGNYGGKMLSYIETHNVIARLNEAFGLKWSWQILSHSIIDKQVYCIGRLKVKIDGETIIKEAFGSKEIEMLKADKNVPVNELGDDLKSSASDALKKAASQLSIGLYIYQAEKPPQTEKKNQYNNYNDTSPASFPPPQVKPTYPVTDPVKTTANRYTGNNGGNGNSNNNNGSGGNGKNKQLSQEEILKYTNRW